eukprot:7174616-Pyramimonas_sp.AAC.1
MRSVEFESSHGTRGRDYRALRTRCGTVLCLTVLFFTVQCALSLAQEVAKACSSGKDAEAAAKAVLAAASAKAGADEDLTVVVAQLDA